MTFVVSVAHRLEAGRHERRLGPSTRLDKKLIGEE